MLVGFVFAKLHNASKICPNLTTISTEPKILWEFGLQKLKTCSLYHENLFIQKVKVISTQVLNNFFSASDIMEAVRGRFHFYGINYKGCVIQVVLLRNKWVEQLLVYFYNTAVENNFLIITRNSTVEFCQRIHVIYELIYQISIIVQTILI